MLKLAKDCIDAGLYTSDLAAMRAFYVDEVGLPYEELLKAGGGIHQHRFGLNGAVLKLNHSRNPLPDGPTGYRGLVIASDKPPRSLTDPDGLCVELVASGTDDVTGVEIRMACRDLHAHDRFYAGALGADRIGANRYRLGTTLIRLEHDPQAQPSSGLMARGFRYTTIQVWDVRAELARLAGLGVSVPPQPRRMGDTALIAFIRDPDDNPIEISQRASLTGPLPNA